MKDYIVARALDLGKYIIDTSATVRDAAAAFGISKSTVHKDVTERLEQLNKTLHSQVQEVLNFNLMERHIRGGISTRNKYVNKGIDE